MATKRELIDQQHQQTLEQSQLVAYWSKTKGISQHDFDQHPRIDDVILLIRIRDEFWSHMTMTQQGQWSAYWGWSYTHKKPLRNNHLKKLEHITISADNTRLFKTRRQQELKHKIHTQRQLTQNHTATRQNKISAYDMTAKDAGLSQTVPWE